MSLTWRSEEIKLIGIESIVTFIRYIFPSTTSPPSVVQVSQLPLFKNFRLFFIEETLSFASWVANSITFEAKWKLFFDSRRLLWLFHSRDRESFDDVIKPVLVELQSASASLLSTLEVSSSLSNNQWTATTQQHPVRPGFTQHVCIETLSVKSFFSLTFNQLLSLRWDVPLLSQSFGVRYCVVHSFSLCNTTSQVNITCDSWAGRPRFPLLL